MKRARLLQWLVFLRVLVSTVFTRFTVNPAATGSSPCFSQKLFRAMVFGTVRLFFEFFCLQTVPPSSFFDILQQTKVPKSPKGLPFYVFRHYATVQNSHFSFFFRKLKKWSFFVSKGSPFNLFDILQYTGFSKSPKDPPFYRFKNFALFEP